MEFQFFSWVIRSYCFSDFFLVAGKRVHSGVFRIVSCERSEEFMGSSYKLRFRFSYLLFVKIL
jgi:hypothetical protein